jgi:hypothetical protein
VPRLRLFTLSMRFVMCCRLLLFCFVICLSAKLTVFQLAKCILSQRSEDTTCIKRLDDIKIFLLDGQKSSFLYYFVYAYLLYKVYLSMHE